MRWDDLFEDMEAQLEQARVRLVEQEAVETARAELSRLTLLERLAAHRGGPVRLRPARSDTLEVHVRVVLQDESRHGEIEGTVDAVGQDFFDVAMHPQDQFRRRSSVTAVRTVGFHSVALVSSLDAG